MSNTVDYNVMYRLGARLGEAAKTTCGENYTDELRQTTEFLTLANNDELGTLFFWLEEGVRNYAATTEQTLLLLREAAETVEYDHEGRYKSTFLI